MKKIILVVLLVAAIGAGAEEMRTNNHAILFSFSGLSDLGLGSYTGGTGYAGIGAKCFNKSGDMALRPMAVFNIGSQKEESPIADYIGEKKSNYSIGILVDGIKHLVKSNISPYIGAGLGYIKTKAKTESGYVKGGKPDITENSTSGLLIRGLLGVEIFIKKNISLSGEYQLSYMSGTQSSKYKSASDTKWSESKTTMSNLEVSAVGRLTLAIYLH
jgi:hypothetical protein